MELRFREIADTSKDGPASDVLSIDVRTTQHGKPRGEHRLLTINRLRTHTVRSTDGPPPVWNA